MDGAVGSAPHSIVPLVAIYHSSESPDGVHAVGLGFGGSSIEPFGATGGDRGNYVPLKRTPSYVSQSPSLHPLTQSPFLNRGGEGGSLSPHLSAGGHFTDNPYCSPSSQADQDFFAPASSRSMSVSPAPSYRSTDGGGSGEGRGSGRLGFIKSFSPFLGAGGGGGEGERFYTPLLEEGGERREMPGEENVLGLGLGIEMSAPSDSVPPPPRQGFLPSPPTRSKLLAAVIAPTTFWTKSHHRKSRLTLSLLLLLSISTLFLWRSTPHLGKSWSRAQELIKWKSVLNTVKEERIFFSEMGNQDGTSLEGGIRGGDGDLVLMSNGESFIYNNTLFVPPPHSSFPTDVPLAVESGTQPPSRILPTRKPIFHPFPPPGISKR